MVGAKKAKLLMQALAVVAVLAMSGTGWAKKGFAGPGVNGTMTGNTVTVEVPVPTKTETTLCDTTTPPPGTTVTTSYAIKAYIFQPSGRMFGIALGYNTEAFTCDTAADQLVTVVLEVFPGLTLKPGPATLLYQVIETATTTTTTTTGSPPVETTTTSTSTNVIYEYGSRVDLH